MSGFTDPETGGGGFDYVQDATPDNPAEGEEWYATGGGTQSEGAYVYDGMGWIEETITDHGQLSGIASASHHQQTTAGTGLSFDSTNAVINALLGDNLGTDANGNIAVQGNTNSAGGSFSWMTALVLDYQEDGNLSAAVDGDTATTAGFDASSGDGMPAWGKFTHRGSINAIRINVDAANTGKDGTLTTPNGDSFIIDSATDGWQTFTFGECLYAKIEAPSNGYTLTVREVEVRAANLTAHKHGM